MSKVTRKSAVPTADLMKLLGVPADATNLQILKIGITTTNVSWSEIAPSATAPRPAPAPEPEPELTPDPEDLIPPEVAKKAVKKPRQKQKEIDG